MRTKRKKPGNAREEKLRKKKRPGVLSILGVSGFYDRERTSRQTTARIMALRKTPYLDMQRERIGFGPTYGEFSYNYKPISELFIIQEDE